MHSAGRRITSLGIFALAGMLFLSGCATKNWVRQEMSTIDPKITEVTNANRENAERIDAVDRRATQGIQAASQSATQAQQAAQAAQTAATAADRKADTANQAIQTTNNRVTTLESRIGTLDNYTSGQPVSIVFPVGSATLTDQARTTLDTVASQVANQRAGYLVEVQGFTDTTGDENFNVGLSQRRAESALRYLVSKSIPLHRISIVGLGEANPVGDNDTRAGREQNRRVEVRILRAAGTTATN